MPEKQKNRQNGEAATNHATELEYKSTDDNLPEINKLFLSVLDNLPIGVAINTIDDGKFRYMNRKFEEIYGWPKDVIVDVKTFFRSVYPDPIFRRKISNRILKDMESGDPARMKWNDVPITKSSGEAAYVTGINIPLIENNLVISTVIDIMERKCAENALKASEAKYRELVENANSIILRTDVEGNITFFNEFAQVFFGYTLDEILGQNVMDTIIPAQSSTGLDQSTLIEKLRKTPNKYLINQNEVIKRNRERAWLAWRNKPLFDDNGSLIGWLSIGNDITERKLAEEALKRSEERYRRTLDSMLEGFQILSPEWRFLYANDAVAKQTGMSKTELIGLALNEVYADIENSDVFPVLKRCMARRESTRMESRLQFAGGIKGWFELSIQPVPQGLSVLTLDITERKKAEAKLINYQAQLRDLAATLSISEDQYRRNLAADLHDKIGPQLAITKMRIGELIETTSVDSEANLELEAVTTLIDRTMQDVQHLILDLYPPAFNELGLGEAIEEMANEFGNEHGIKINFREDGIYEQSNHVVRSLVYRIVRELLNNIVKHAKATEASIFLQFREKSLLIRVSDNGQGFATDNLTGLQKKHFGLFHIRERVSHFGGQFRIKSMEGHGTMITVQLPEQTTGRN